MTDPLTEPPTDPRPDWNARLTRMANDIARNFAAIGHDHAVKATADHVAHFWEPRMKARLFDLAAQPDSGLSPAARAAAELLRRGAPAPQTRATESLPGASDAG